MKKRSFVPVCSLLEERALMSISPKIIISNPPPVSSYPIAPPVDHPASYYAYQVVPGSLFHQGGPVYTDVRQGAAADCWLLSSLAEVAARRPQVITGMFTDLGTFNENGYVVELYSVQFHDADGVARSVTVDNELPANGKAYAWAGSNVTWVALAEKAYAQANALGYVRTFSPGRDAYYALNSGDPIWALSAVTGLSASNYAVNPVDVKAALDSGLLVVISTYNPTDPRLIRNHSYAVILYNANSVTNEPFKIYNPKGSYLYVSSDVISQQFVNEAIGN